MALLNIFNKGKTQKTDKPVGQKAARKAGAAKRQDLAEKESVVEIAGKKESTEKKNKQKIDVASILTRAHITEKASRLSEANQYVFCIAPLANKDQVRKAVESYYNVGVESVNIVKIPGKRHRRAKGVYREKDLRKAIVKIKQGQKIELLPK